MDKLNELADLIFPDIKETIKDLEEKYPNRVLCKNAEVTRFAPSPTGYLHTGGLFTSLVAYLLAKSTNGVCYFRLEDTDSKREIKEVENLLLNELLQFGIYFDEGKKVDDGKFGPYKQSKRSDIYKIVIKELIKKNLAYPCFCSYEDLDEIREIQKSLKQIPGYYGNYAKCRYLTVEEAIQNIKDNKSYIIRFRSKGNHNNKIKIYDEIRGDIEISENDIDIVILKNDGLPTYHFAHVVDDHFMHTTIVTRGEEWISSLPIHIELFKSLNWIPPKYAHLPLINKLENNSKRKLSKRKDPEAAISFFLKEGYPIVGLLVYLMSIINSDFEQWLIVNKTFDIFKFPFDIHKINFDGAIFDLNKLNYFSREYLSTLSAKEISSEILKYACKYDLQFAELIKKDFSYFEKIMNIERDKKNPRKDYVKYSDVYPLISFFYDVGYKKDDIKNFFSNFQIDKKVVTEILLDFINSNDYSLNEQDWFCSLQKLAVKHNFALTNKDYKNNIDKYLGSVSDVASIIRVAVTSKKNSPNLYYVLQILNKEKVTQRIEQVIKFI